MFKIFGCVILAALSIFSFHPSYANTAIYKKDDFKINVTGFIDGQLGTRDGVDSRHNLYFGLATYNFTESVPVSFAMRVNNGSNAKESYGGTAIEDFYLRIGDGSTDSDDRFLAFKEQSRGRIEIGITGPMSEKLRVSSTEFSRGTGGVSGDWFRYVKYDLDSSTTILNPQMPITNGFTTSTYAAPVSGVLQDYYSGSQALKINLYSPKFDGLLFGLGYTPSLYDRYAIIGLQNSYSKMTADAVNNFNTVNSLSAVAHYEKKYSQNLQLVSSLIWEYGKAQKLNKSNDWEQRQNLNAWMYGLVLSYDEWHFGGSYGDYGRSLYLKQQSEEAVKLNDDGSLSRLPRAYFYDLGLGYAKKDYGASLTYFASNYAANKVTSLIISLDRRFMYNQTMGLKAYIEGGYVDIKHANFHDAQGHIISSEKKSGLLFSGVRAMF